MWNRKELKEKAKVAFKANYWKGVFAAMVLAIAVGGGSFASGSNGLENLDQESITQIEKLGDTILEHKGLIGDAQKEQELVEDVEGMKEALKEASQNAESLDQSDVVAAGVVVGIAAFVAVAISIAVSFFVLNPLVVGCKSFFYKNLNESAELSELTSGFKTGYKRNVKAMFLVDLYTFLWGLLFVIPGIVKAYEYRMVPYLLAQDETMDAKEAIAMSSAMMKGNKWKAFVLDLSFLGWHILSLFTCGMLEVFYVAPYEAQTDAALFEAVK